MRGQTTASIGNRRDTYVKKFKARVDVAPDSGCWYWQGSTKGLDTQPIPLFILCGERMSARRASWLLFVGDVPPGSRVYTRCGNTLCVNPAHLKAPLVATTIEAIMSSRIPGATATDIAKRFGVTPRTVQRIWDDKWRPYISVYGADLR